MSKNRNKSLRRSRIIDAIWTNVLVFLLALIWIMPVLWIILASFSNQTGYISTTFFPKAEQLTINNYVRLFTETNFLTWVGNTMIVALLNTIFTTLFTVLTAYSLSRFRFKMRKTFLNITLILGMFPGFMSMVAVYFILAELNLTNSIFALLVYYVAGAGLGFFICKGYFDTIPKDIDEALLVDGSPHIVSFIRVFLPLAAPIIIYTALMAFMAPWADYILAGLIFTKDSSKTVAVGLYGWMDSSKINTYFTLFAAGATIVAIPIVALYIALQRFFVEGISAGAVKG